MAKNLEAMSLEELWQLFPIFLVEPDPAWKAWYEEESERLQSFLPQEKIVRISHVGSTSLETIWAKPIIDILVEIPLAADMEGFKKSLLEHGYLLMSEAPNRISFNKGYRPEGFAERVFHLHLRYEGDHDELYFRDYLRDHPALIKDYQELKLRLWKQYEHNRDAYTEAKGDFIRSCTQKAKELYPDRYERDHQ